MKLSRAGLDLIKQEEGFRSQAYRDAVGVWTIGYGHTGGVREGDVVTEQEAANLLATDVITAENAVHRLVTVPISQAQFDALVSFTFNVGAGALEGSTLLRKLNAGDYAGATAEFKKWVHGGNVVLPGLVKRRNREAALFAGTPAPASVAVQEKPMAPFIIPALTILAELLPTVSKLFKGESPTKVAERNIDLVQAIADKVIPTVIASTNAVNVEQAIQKVQAQPDVQVAADAAVRALYYELSEVGGGIEAAREQTTKLLTTGPTWAAVGYGAIMSLLAVMVVGGGGALMWFMLMDPNTPAEQRGMLLGAVVAFMSAIIGYFFGSSVSSRQSGQSLQRIAETK